jgi:hypothetical protein
MSTKAMKKAGIRQWVGSHPGLSAWERERIFRDNEQAVRNLKHFGLPMDRDFGSFDTIAEASKTIPDEHKRNSLFIIRCPLRSGDDIKRALFVPWNEVVRFVEELPGGYEKYTLGIREVTIASWSGTIICSQNGEHVLIELWKGKHLEMDEGGWQSSFRGVYDENPPAPRRFVWSDGCTEEMKRMMLGALSFLSPTCRLNRSMHVEFSVTPKGYRFHGLSFLPFWTEAGSRPPFPSWGD